MARAWGRVYNENGTYQWVDVETDSNGFNDDVMLTCLCQVLKLSPNESPFFSTYGIAAQQSVVQQVFPDFYVYQTQQQFAPYFASLTVTKLQAPSPMYEINVLTHTGAKIQTTVAT